MTDTTELQTLLDAATPGPWKLDGIAIGGNGPSGGDVCLMGEPAQYAGDTSFMLDNWQANAALIALTPTLAADVIRLTAANAALMVRLDRARDDALREARTAVSFCPTPMDAVAAVRALLKGADRE